MALLPIFGLIALGLVFRRVGFPGDGFWPQVERLIYFVLFPALLIDRLSHANLVELQVGPLAAAIVCAVFAVGAATWLCKVLLGLSGGAYGALFMAGVRFNTYVGIAAAEALWQGAGASLAALVLAVWVPLVNLLSVLVLTQQLGGGWRAMPRTMVAAVTNPLVVACAIGAALDVSGLALPLGIGPLIGVMADAALPLGLLAVGAGLDLAGLVPNLRVLVLASVFKLAVMPAAMLAITGLLGVTGLPAAMAVLFAALPGSPAAYILARQVGGDGRLMAGVITLTTVASAATLPAWIAFVS
jgi:hypothetical protein